jgi:sulfonate transport system permease protein
MVWFGVGERTTIFLIALAAFFPIYINTAHGASEVPCLLIRAGRMLGANKIALFKTVIFPSAFPSVMVGLRLGLGVSWAYLVLGELTGVTRGLGAVMMDSRMMGQVEMILASMVCIAIMGMLTDRLLLRICRSIFPYPGGEMK